MSQDWNSKFFNAFEKIFPPARPSITELNVYAIEIHKLKEKLKRKLDILILGSTVEFIDWATEENMNITIIDYSRDYYSKACNNLKYKAYSKNFVMAKWEEMDFNDCFDVIIGDCTIGNIEEAKQEEFITRASKALRKGGLFLGKNFLMPKENNPKDLEYIIKKYNKSYSYCNSFTYMIFDLVILFLENNKINFNKIYEELLEMNKKKLLSNEAFEYFIGIKELGEINCNFYIPRVDEYEKMINRYLKIRNIKYGKEVYSKKFPLYILEKN